MKKFVTISISLLLLAPTVFLYAAGQSGGDIERPNVLVIYTDDHRYTGVHALGQVAHFDSDAERSERSWVLGLNTHMPVAVSALWVRSVDTEFHARFSAFSRSYRYIILNRWTRPALDASRVSWCRAPLDADKMNAAARALLGEHDFSSFRASACQARHASRDIQDISVKREGDQVVLDISANGFLYHMVRNIAGSLLAIGKAEIPVSRMSELLEARNRTLAPATAAPGGLYFLGARYPKQYDLPRDPPSFPRGWDQS